MTIKPGFLVHFSDHHLKTGPFDYWTFLYHLNTGLVRYSDASCIVIFVLILLQSTQILKFFNFQKNFGVEPEIGSTPRLEKFSMQHVSGNEVFLGHTLPIQIPDYSGDLNTDHLNTGNI